MELDSVLILEYCKQYFANGIRLRSTGSEYCLQPKRNHVVSNTVNNSINYRKSIGKFFYKPIDCGIA